MPSTNSAQIHYHLPPAPRLTFGMNGFREEQSLCRVEWVGIDRAGQGGAEKIQMDRRKGLGVANSSIKETTNRSHLSLGGGKNRKKHTFRKNVDCS